VIRDQFSPFLTEKGEIIDRSICLVDDVNEEDTTSSFVS
jgi:hypothetical protein